MLVSLDTWAWNALGHRIIGEIAYQNLMPAVKKKLNSYNHAVDSKRHRQSFANAAVWLDRLRSKDLSILKTMHYINVPLSSDGNYLTIEQRMNVIWSINMAIKVLTNPQASMVDKGIALRILLHVVGDIHQPMHTTTHVSEAFAQGDHGGNLQILPKNAVATNLHAYWDRGGGLLLDKHPSAREVKHRARMMTQQVPCATIKQSDPTAWVMEAHQIARNTAYPMLSSSNLSAYQPIVQRQSELQLIRAGCRLANMLNQIVVAKQWSDEKQFA